MSERDVPTPQASAETGASADRGARGDDYHGCEPHFLALLVCPVTRTSLAYDAERQALISRPERLVFPIRNGVPILVREEARVLTEVEAAALRLQP